MVFIHFICKRLGGGTALSRGLGRRSCWGREREEEGEGGDGREREKKKPGAVKKVSVKKDARGRLKKKK